MKKKRILPKRGGVIVRPNVLIGPGSKGLDYNTRIGQPCPGHKPHVIDWDKKVEPLSEEEKEALIRASHVGPESPD